MRLLRVSATSRVPSAASHAARGLERRLPRLPGSRRASYLLDDRAITGDLDHDVAELVCDQEVSVAEELDAAGYPKLSRWGKYQRRRPLSSTSTTSTPNGWSANATRNVPCGVGEALSGIRFDSDERSSVETRSPRRDSRTISHWVTRRIGERFACDEAVRVVDPPFRRIREQRAVRVEPQRPVPGPQVQRFLDRRLVDDDRRSVCGARCVDRVAQPRGRERTARPAAFGGPY